MDLKPFTVVHFVEENSYEVVPSNWITEDQTSSAFPSNRPKGLQKLQSKSDGDLDSSWPLWKVNIVKSYDTFERANRKAQNLVKGFESSDIEKVKKSRRRNYQPRQGVPFPQHLENLGDDVTSTLGDRDVENEVLIADVNNLPPIGTTEGNQDLVLQVHSPEVILLREEFRRFQEEWLKNQGELLAEIKDLKKLLTQVLASSNSSTPAYASPIWPLRSVSDLQKAEELVKDPRCFSREVGILQRIGGDPLSKHVYNTLESVISHELSLQIRLTDTTGKVAFKNLVLAKPVRESIKATRFDEKEVTDSKINGLMGSWFRQAPGRKGGSGLRKKKAEIHQDGDAQADQEEENRTGTPADSNENSSGESSQE